MRISLPMILLAALAPLAAFTATAADTTPAYVTAAINDPARKEDSADDARRQVAAVMAFTRVKPGDKVAELAPGEGYWTRVFSGVVGANGHVYTVWPKEFDKFAAKSYANWEGLVKAPPYTNVSLVAEPAADFSVPEKVDLVFTSQNYHDYHDKFTGPVDIAAFDKQVFDALKPGGYFVVIDHVATAASGPNPNETMHRIDPELVKKEVEAAGFVFDGSSDALKNPNDPHTVGVFDKGIRGHTDQFIFRFKKPM